MICLNGRVHFKHRGKKKSLGLGKWQTDNCGDLISLKCKLPKTFSALYMYLWNSNLNEITGDHSNENYAVNMWGKYCRIYPEFANKKTTVLYLKAQLIYEN